MTFRCLWVKTDVNLKFDSQIKAVVESWFSLKAAGQEKAYFFRQLFVTIIYAFVTTQLDSYGSLYVGVNASAVAFLQMLQNAMEKFIHIKQVLKTPLFDNPF